jgi:glycosyltransferase involved in cell wall biosynthesis
LREDLPLNHHSFPTKFAEYLASGVPVLMTPFIYSIAPMVIENNLGEVIEIKNDYSAEIEQIYSKYKSNLPIKNHCSNFAQTELMWQNKAISIFNIISNMIQ